MSVGTGERKQEKFLKQQRKTIRKAESSSRVKGRKGIESKETDLRRITHFKALIMLLLEQTEITTYELKSPSFPFLFLFPLLLLPPKLYLVSCFTSLNKIRVTGEEVEQLCFIQL